MTENLPTTDPRFSFLAVGCRLNPGRTASASPPGAGEVRTRRTPPGTCADPGVAFSAASQSDHWRSISRPKWPFAVIWPPGTGSIFGLNQPCDRSASLASMSTSPAVGPAAAGVVGRADSTLAEPKPETPSSGRLPKPQSLPDAYEGLRCVFAASTPSRPLGCRRTSLSAWLPGPLTPRGWHLSSIPRSMRPFLTSGSQPWRSKQPRSAGFEGQTPACRRNSTTPSSSFQTPWRRPERGIG